MGVMEVETSLVADLKVGEINERHTRHAYETDAAPPQAQKQYFQPKKVAFPTRGKRPFCVGSFLDAVAVDFAGDLFGDGIIAADAGAFVRVKAAYEQFDVGFGNAKLLKGDRKTDAAEKPAQCGNRVKSSGPILVGLYAKHPPT